MMDLVYLIINMSKIASNKIAGFIEQLNALPVTKLYKLDAILSDLANHIHDINEALKELKDEIENFDEKSKEHALSDIQVVKKQLTWLFTLLCKMEYDSHYMDRTLSILGSTLNDIEGMK